MEHTTATFTTADGMRLATQSWLPDVRQPVRGILILVHGYGEHIGRYQHVADYFVGRGYAVHGMDSRGHGRSADKSKGSLGYFERFMLLVDDLAGFVQHIDSTRPAGRPLYLIGHSMGGMQTLYYLIRHQPSPNLIRAVVTSGAYLDAGVGVPALLKRVARDLLPRFAPRLGIVRVNSATLSRDPAVVQQYDTDPLNFHGKAPARVAAEFIAAGEFVRANLGKITLPILCLHGSADPLVRAEATRWVYQGVSSPDKTIKLYEGLYHEILNEPERNTVMADIGVWLEAHGAV